MSSIMYEKYNRGESGREARIKGLQERIDRVCKQHGLHENMSDEQIDGLVMEDYDIADIAVLAECMGFDREKESDFLKKVVERLRKK